MAAQDGLLLFDGGHETLVTSAAPGRLGFASVMARRVGRFLLVWRNGEDRIELPVAGRVWDDGLGIDLDQAQPGSAAASRIAEGERPDVALMRSALEGKVIEPVKKRAGRVISTLFLVVACIVLGTYVGSRLYHALVTTVPRVAYLATEVSIIASPTSGRLAFAAGEGAISAGEPVVGVENARGKTVLLDATDAVRVVSLEQRIGAHVKRGDPVLTVAAADPAVYLVAIVSREQAFQLASGTTVHYALLDASAPRSQKLFVPAGGLMLTALPATLGADPLFEVRVRIEGSDLLARAAPVSVEFEQSLSDRTSAVLVGFGVPATTSAALLTPVAWIESQIRNWGDVS